MIRERDADDRVLLDRLAAAGWTVRLTYRQGARYWLACNTLGYRRGSYSLAELWHDCARTPHVSPVVTPPLSGEGA